MKYVAYFQVSPNSIIIYFGSDFGPTSPVGKIQTIMDSKAALFSRYPNSYPKCPSAV